MSMTTSGPVKIILTTRIKAYLQVFICSYLQKRSFILGSNTTTKQQKIHFRRLFRWTNFTHLLLTVN